MRASSKVSQEFIRRIDDRKEAFIILKGYGRMEHPVYLFNTVCMNSSIRHEPLFVGQMACNCVDHQWKVGKKWEVKCCCEGTLIPFEGEKYCILLVISEDLFIRCINLWEK